MPHHQRRLLVDPLVGWQPSTRPREPRRCRQPNRQCLPRASARSHSRQPGAPRRRRTWTTTRARGNARSKRAAWVRWAAGGARAATLQHERRHKQEVPRARPQTARGRRGAPRVPRTLSRLRAISCDAREVALGVHSCGLAAAGGAARTLVGLSESRGGLRFCCGRPCAPLAPPVAVHAGRGGSHGGIQGREGEEGGAPRAQGRAQAGGARGQGRCWD